MDEIDLEDPMILRDAARRFGVSYMWLRRQAQEAGTVRWQKVGKYVLVERADVEKVTSTRRKIEELEERARESKKAADAKSHE